MRFGIFVLATLTVPVVSGQSPSPVASPSPSALPGPSVGDVVPAFDAPGMAGSNAHVEFPKGQKTVLIFFQASCPHCQKMIPEWNQAFERKSEALRVLGIVMDNPPPDFFQVLHVAFPVLRSPGYAFLRDLKIRSVPVTMRVDPGGRVADVVVGETNLLRLGELFAP
jgi:peroxiredoxin